MFVKWIPMKDSNKIALHRLESKFEIMYNIPDMMLSIYLLFKKN